MAIPLTTAEIKARYPEFAATADASIQLAIDDAIPMFDVVRWGDFYAQGMAAYVAHLLTANKTTASGNANGVAGVVQTKRVGDMQVGYATAQYSAKDADYAATVYGRKYLSLRRIVGMGAVAV